MPISNSNELFFLIKSLEKSEKRAFRLYVNRLESNKEVQFIKLFEVIDKMKDYNEKMIEKKFPKLSPVQFSNLKRHLYGQIMKSLRLSHSNKYSEIKISENLDFAKILYGKGLYKQSLKLLDKIIPIAKKTYKSLLYFEILEFQKLIESRHITRSRSIANKVESLISQTEKLKEIISSTSDFMNLSLRIQGLYIKMGIARSERDIYFIREYLNANLPRYDIRKLSFYEYVLLHQSLVWYNHMTLNFLYSYKHATQWVQHFDDKAYMKIKDPDLYFRGLHYAMTHAFNLRSWERFKMHYDAMLRFYEENQNIFLTNTKILYHSYKSNADLNGYYLKGNYKEGTLEIHKSIEPYMMHNEKIDPHRNAILNYKLAWLYFGAGNYDVAIDYLQEILKETKKVLRIDVLAYAKLLHLMAHVHLENYEFADNELKNVKKFFAHIGEQSKCTDIVFDLLRRVIKNREAPYEEIIQKMLADLDELRLSRLGSRPFLYFDFYNWVLTIAKNTCLEDEFRKSPQAV